jgi:hypothetical protein
VSRRASLPGAEELFRRTGPEQRTKSTSEQDNKSTKLQVAEETPEPKAPKHEEKVTFYCTRSDLMAIERARLTLRAEHGVAADRGRIVRAALAYVLDDFESRSDDSILLRTLSE